MKIGHFYLGKNRTFLLWLDSVTKKILTSAKKSIRFELTEANAVEWVRLRTK
jgi:hypothetical protein